MKYAAVTAAALVFGLAVPQWVHAQTYSQQPSINVPLPNFGGGPGREQQAQGDDRERHCADLRGRADDLRERADDAQSRDDAMRARDRLHETQDQLRRDCDRH